MLVTGGRSVPSSSLSSVSTELSKSTLLNEAPPYRRNVRLAVAQCAHGRPQPDNFRLERRTLPATPPGGVLLRVL
jgi:hypothetical protein